MHKVHNRILFIFYNGKLIDVRVELKSPHMRKMRKRSQEGHSIGEKTVTRENDGDRSVSSDVSFE